MEKQVKKLSGIKLNQLSKIELEKRQMNALKGGSGCTCQVILDPPNGAWTNSSHNRDN